jgi:hypothetical protein
MNREYKGNSPQYFAILRRLASTLIDIYRESDGLARVTKIAVAVGRQNPDFFAASLKQVFHKGEKFSTGSCLWKT